MRTLHISFFCFNDTATTEIYTLSLHDALPILLTIFDRMFGTLVDEAPEEPCVYGLTTPLTTHDPVKIALHEWLRLARRSEEHTSELQSRQYLVCRLLLEKKKHKNLSDTNTAAR